MESKSLFMSKCFSNMAKHISEMNTKATLNVMDKHQLSSFSDSDVIPQDLIDNCVNILSSRINIMKGGTDANLFLSEMKG